MSDIKSNLSLTLTEFINKSSDITQILRSPQLFDDEKAFPIQSTISLILPLSESTLRSLSEFDRAKAISADELLLLEAAASNLWNSVAIANRSVTGYASLMASIKLLAILMLRIYDSASVDFVQSRMRTFKCLLKLFEFCMFEDLLDIAKKARSLLDSLLIQLAALEEDSFRNEDTVNAYRMGKAKGIFLSLSLALKSKDHELARVYQNNADLANISNIISSSSELSELCVLLYNTGMDLYEQEEIESSLFFTETCLKYLDSGTAKSVEVDTRKSIKISSKVLNVKCLKKSSISNRKELVRKILTSMLDEFRDSIEVYVLYFEELRDEGGGSTDGLYTKSGELMMQMVMSVPVSAHFEQVMGTLKDWAAENRHSSLKCLDFILSNMKNYPLSRDQRESGFITRIWITLFTKHNLENVEVTNDVAAFFKMTEKVFTQKISRKTRSCILTMLWKEGNSATKIKNFKDAICWFKLGLARVLQATDDESNIDTGKFLRMITSCLFQMGCYEEIIENYKRMSQIHKTHPLAQYYLFKCHLKLDDEVGALKCIDTIKNSKGDKYLLTLAVCIIDSKKVLSNEASIKVIYSFVQGIMEAEQNNFEHFTQTLSEDSVIMPVLLKCIISMINEEFEGTRRDDKFSEYINMGIEIFNYSLKLARNMKRAHYEFVHPLQKFSSGDLEWFSSKAYNIACISLKSNILEESIGLCAISIEFNDLIPRRLDEKANPLDLWLVQAQILKLLAMSMRHGDTDIKWNEIRTKCIDMKTKLNPLTTSDHSNSQFPDQVAEISKCRSKIFIFQFHGELIVGVTEAAIEIIRECEAQFSGKALIEIYETFSDLILGQEGTKNRKTQVLLLSTIIEKQFTIINVQITRKLMSCIRFIYETIEFNPNICDTIFRSLYLIIKMGNTESQNIPLADIEWLATSCWNFGVACIIQENKQDLGVLWCAKAVAISEFVNERLGKQFEHIWHDLCVSVSMDPTSLATALSNI